MDITKRRDTIMGALTTLLQLEEWTRKKLATLDELRYALAGKYVEDLLGPVKARNPSLMLAIARVKPLARNNYDFIKGRTHRIQHGWEVGYHASAVKIMSEPGLCFSVRHNREWSYAHLWLKPDFTVWSEKEMRHDGLPVLRAELRDDFEIERYLRNRIKDAPWGEADSRVARIPEMQEG